MSFNVRVYGILIDRERGILLSDEIIRGKPYVKFPGGGMEYGEGTRDCLKREFMEEMHMEIEVNDHFYTTDFFQGSAFREHDQIISVYYFVRPLREFSPPGIHIDAPGEYVPGAPHASQESFRFVPLTDFSGDILSFPIDKVVGNMLRKQFSGPGEV